MMKKNSKRKRIKSILVIVILMLLSITSSYSQSPVIKVDFDMTGRPETEVNEPGYLYWPIEQVSSTSRTIDGVDFSITYAGSGSGLKSNWVKALIQAPYYVRLSGDGLTVDNGEAGAEIIMKISNLSAGNHTLLVYHNNVDSPDGNTFCPIDIYVNGTQTYNDLMPTVRVESNFDAATSYHSFSVSSGQDVEIRFAAETSSSASNKNVMINGFELNVPNPDGQASFPFPKNNDEHFDGDNGNVTLSWEAASNAVSHDVYIGTNLTELENADHTSSLFKGNQNNTTYYLSGLYSMDTYYWRIDEISSGGTVTKGNIWYFRPRQLAFPDAEGYGRHARGGRGGVVVHVTNLNDNGSGSLREAIENDIGPRTIVFDVSGIITLEDRLVLGDKYVTVAGQTAPGKGVCLRSAPFGVTGTDAVVLHVRARLGAGQTYDCMGMTGGNYSILDHCSMSWGIDEVFSSRSGKNITLQRSMISEALNVAGHENYPEGSAHGFAASISGDIGSFHHNLLAHCAGRNWSLAGGLDGSGYYAGRLDLFNNVVYNWDYRTTDGGAHEVNFVNNYYKPGPSTTFFYAINPQYDGFPGTQQYYFAGNVMPGYFDESNQESGRTNSGTPPYDLWVNQPFFPSYAKIESAGDAFKSVVSDVGCTQPVFDDHDLRIATETRDGTYTYTGSETGLRGLIDHQDDAGGYENYPVVYRDADFDADGDGLPNWWESYYGLNINSGANDFSDANADIDHDGYTNLDDYLQWMGKPHYIINSNETVVVDLAKTFLGYTKSPSYTSSNVVKGSVSIQSGIATFTPDISGMGSFKITVTDGEGSSMTKEFVVFIEGGGSATTYSLTTSVNGQGSISPSSGNFNEGSVVSLTATAAAGWEFDSWSGDASGSGNPVSITMDGNTTVTANFSEISVQTYTLTTSVSGQGSISPSSGNFNEGSVVSLSATADAGWFFVGWSGDASGSGNPVSITMDGNKMVTANFSEVSVQTYTLTTSVSGQGSVSPSSGNFNEGSVVSLTATADAGWGFVGWSGNASGSTNPVSITMDGDKSILANFTETTNPTTLTIQENETGFCSVDGSVDNNNDGFTGDGFANTDNASGEGITWSVNIPTAGSYSVVWKYANGGSTDRTAQLMEDGSTIVSNISMPSSGSWTSWIETSAVNVNLSAGTKLIRLQATNSSGLANIDNITISGGSISAVACTGLKMAATATEMADKDVNFYPVPVDDLLNIQFNRELTETVNIYLYDATGKMIKSSKAKGLSHTLNMSGLPIGLYTVKISGENLNVSERVVKQ